jgi:methylthioribose-1-phosphate isomerase
MDYDRYDRVRAVRWTGDALDLLDQRLLPQQQERVLCSSSAEVTEAIHALVVRGAPAIGIAAAWGVVLAARGVQAADRRALRRPGAGHGPAQRLASDRGEPRLGAAPYARRPGRQRQRLARGSRPRPPRSRPKTSPPTAAWAARRRADRARLGVLTHCNTGSLATAGFGTALGVIRAGVAEGRIHRVFAGETRPWLQGARLTVWELLEDGIPATLIADAAAAAPDAYRGRCSG